METYLPSSYKFRQPIIRWINKPQYSLGSSLTHIIRSICPFVLYTNFLKKLIPIFEFVQFCRSLKPRVPREIVNL